MPSRWSRYGTIMDPDFEKSAMPNLSIKEVPEEIAQALRERAARNHRSLQGELMAILYDALRPVSGSAEADLRRSEGPRGTRTIEEFARESRVLYPEPVREGPLAVDIIRADRDSR